MSESTNSYLSFCPWLSYPDWFHFSWLITSCTVDALKFWTLLACQQILDKQSRPRSDCFWRSSLIRIFPVCYSDKHFVNSSPENKRFIWEKKDKGVRNFRTLTIHTTDPRLGGENCTMLSIHNFVSPIGVSLVLDFISVKILLAYFAAISPAIKYASKRSGETAG